ncbi:hypothetical protein BN1263130034 [Stenotrophomonas maltophilia]|nr:hypothetical protein BN1263130034 [Stenotrophomonas maltophilia]
MLVVVAGQEPAPAPLVAPPGGVRIDLAERAGGQPRAAAIAQLGTVAGCDVDHRCGALAELRRQCAVHQADALDGARVQGLAEAGDRFGQQHAVDAVLQVGVVATHMHAAIGVLDHARGLQQYLAEWRGGTQRLLLDVLGGDLVLAAADVRRQRVAGLVELGVDGDRIQILDGRSGGVGCRGEGGQAGQGQGEGDAGSEGRGLHGGRGGGWMWKGPVHDIEVLLRNKSCACPGRLTMQDLAAGVGLSLPFRRAGRPDRPFASAAGSATMTAPHPGSLQ